MHPILFKIPLPHWNLPKFLGGGELHAFPIYAYGVMLGLSLVVGWYISLTMAKQDGLPRETMANNYVFTAICAIVGARVLYILTNLSEFHSWKDYLAIRSGGLVAYGGFLGGFIGSWIYCNRKGVRLQAWADVAVPSLASGLLFTRIGCYLFGCDFGKPSPRRRRSGCRSSARSPSGTTTTRPGSSSTRPVSVSRTPIRT
jgi:prolipoprotein diacylglyceryltransferase